MGNPQDDRTSSPMAEVNKGPMVMVQLNWLPSDMVDEFVWVFLESLKEPGSLPFLQAPKSPCLRFSHCLREELA